MRRIFSNLLPGLKHFISLLALVVFTFSRHLQQPIFSIREFLVLAALQGSESENLHSNGKNPVTGSVQKNEKSLWRFFYTVQLEFEMFYFQQQMHSFSGN